MTKKKNIQKLQWLINEFVSGDIPEEDQEPNSFIEDTKKRLVEILFDGDSSKFQTELNNIKKFQNRFPISYIHSQLYSLWNDYTTVLSKIERGEHIGNYNNSGSWTYDADELVNLQLGEETAQLRFNIILNVEDGVIKTSFKLSNIIKKFVFLLNDLPVKYLCECEAEDCPTWFIKTYSGAKREKKYCCNKCASREGARRRRKKKKTKKIEV